MDKKKKFVLKGQKPYRNANAWTQPGYTGIKLNDDVEAMKSIASACYAVKGQDYACHSSQEYLFGILRKKNEKGPAACLTFAGPPAVGKTFVAEAIAKGLKRPYLRLDMSSYSDKEAQINLCGLHKSYKSACPGKLTSFVNDNPVCVILFDEIEKAHPNTLNVLLQLLNEGEVRDLCWERTISFRDAICIFTTNAGRSAYDNGSYNFSSTPVSTIVKALEEEANPVTHSRCLSRELVSRLAAGKIIVFNRLRPEALQTIVTNQIDELRTTYYSNYDMPEECDMEELARIILYSQGGDADVRSLMRATKEFFSTHIGRVAGMVNRDCDFFRLRGIRYKFDYGSATREAVEILRDASTSRVLTYGSSLKSRLSPKKINQIEFVEADDNLNLAAMRRVDPAIFIMEVTEKNKSKADELFKCAVKLNIPVYVYTKDRKILLTDYSSGGAVDCYVPEGNHCSINWWVYNALDAISLAKGSDKLFRSNKVLTYRVSYKYSKKTAVADVVLSDFATQPAIAGRDSALFLNGAAVPDTTFDDIIGADEAKEELAPVIRQLKNYKTYKRNGIRIPRGILFDGPPGTGKTTLAKAVANAADLPFIQLNATQLLSKYVGEGEAKVRDIFASARRYAPSIVFIDEIDCIAKDRMAGDENNTHLSGITNALLSELDGFASEDAPPVFVIGATNYNTRSEDTKLDKALLRRFDRKIYVGLPDVASRQKYLARELNKYDFSQVSPKCMAAIARRSVGWNLANLNLVIQNAIRHAECRDGSFALTDGVLREAFERFSDGNKKSYSAAVIKKTACHEAGHAVVATLLSIELTHVTIAARSNYGGYVSFSDEDKAELTKSECLNRICMAMAGRAAEVIFYGEDGISTGASSDIRMATGIAKRMMCVYGMNEQAIAFIDGSADDSAEVKEFVQNTLVAQYNRAVALIQDNRDGVQSVAEALVRSESITDEELKELLNAEQRRQIS